MQSKRLLMQFGFVAAVFASGFVLVPGTAQSQKPPTQDHSPKPGAGVSGTGTPQSGTTPGTMIQIKKQLTGDFTYRFVTSSDQTIAPAPLPAPSTPDAAVPVAIPTSIPAKSAVLEVVDKTRGNVARIPIGSETAVTLTEASFKYIQTVFVEVKHEGKAVTDVLVTMADTPHKYSMAWPLKAADNGVAQFANVPMGEQITVAVNGAGHPSITSTNTLIPGHPVDGYHWPTITVDWKDVATITPPTPVAPPPPVASTGSESRPSSETGSARRDEGSGGGAFSSFINMLLGLVVIAAVIYGAVWAFNKGHVKALLDKAGVNTSELNTAGANQPSPFDKPARTPLSPITEGTADPFAGGAAIGGGVAAAPVSTGPRLVANAGAYSGSIFALAGVQADIGRDAGNAVPLPNDTNSSRRHATISVNGSAYTVTDNASSNGTFLNGVRIPPNSPQPLRAGDELQVGMTRFRFEA